MIPSFDIEGGLPLALARFLSVAGLVLAGGSVFYLAFVAPRGLAPAVQARLRRLSLLSFGGALAGAGIWLLAQTFDFAGAVAPSDIWSVLAHTEFGHLVAARAVLLAFALVALRLRHTLFSAALACTALVLQAGHSHALAMGGSPLLVISAGLHVLAAGLWLGALPALWIALSDAEPVLAHTAARRFSFVGMACVAAILGTAIFQFSVLVMGLPGLVGTAYGWMVGVKIVLFAVLIILAARNKLALTPALAGTDPAHAVRGLRRSIAVEVTIGVAVLAAAGVLTELQPPMHLQPLWPFAERFTLDTINEDPDFKREVLEAAAALAGGGAILLAALLMRRFRLVAAGLAAVIAWFAVPHLSLLLVEATPYSFYHSPTGFSAASIVQGAALYPTHCAVCHGASGKGNGPLAKTLPVPPADLTAGHLWMHSDGELFGWLTDGIDAPRGGKAMPGFGHALSEDERWALIDFIHANNAGQTMHATGGWSPPLTAPAFDMACAQGRRRLDALHGEPVRLILGGTGKIDTQPGLVTILAAPSAEAPRAGLCIASDPLVEQAMMIVSGMGMAMPGTAFLIDGDGWLRAMQMPGASPSWSDPQVLAAAIGDMHMHKVKPKPAAAMPMNMPM